MRWTNRLKENDASPFALARRLGGDRAARNFHRARDTSLADVDHPATTLRLGGGLRVLPEVEPGLPALFCRALNEERKRVGRAVFFYEHAGPRTAGVTPVELLPVIRGGSATARRAVHRVRAHHREGISQQLRREDACLSAAHLTHDELTRLIGCRGSPARGNALTVRNASNSAARFAHRVNANT